MNTPTTDPRLPDPTPKSDPTAGSQPAEQGKVQHGLGNPESRQSQPSAGIHGHAIAVRSDVDESKVTPSAQTPGQMMTAKATTARAKLHAEQSTDAEWVKAWFLTKVNKNAPVSARRPDLGPCWEWTGSRFPKGYGQVRKRYLDQSAHRAAHELFIGPIPAGYQVDHLCVNPPCVNPDHLEAVTQQENNARSNSVAVRNAAKTHCHKGHPFDEENTIRHETRRRCRECDRQFKRESRRKARERKTGAES